MSHKDKEIFVYLLDLVTNDIHPFPDLWFLFDVLRSANLSAKEKFFVFGVFFCFLFHFTPFKNDRSINTAVIPHTHTHRESELIVARRNIDALMTLSTLKRNKRSNW